jgi:hypothetical protein
MMFLTVHASFSEAAQLKQTAGSSSRVIFDDEGNSILDGPNLVGLDMQDSAIAKKVLGRGIVNSLRNFFWTHRPVALEHKDLEQAAITMQRADLLDKEEAKQKRL